MESKVISEINFSSFCHSQLKGRRLFFFSLHGPAICNCIHLSDSHSLMFAAECAGQWKASGQKRGEADEHNSALIARLIWCECNHGVICLKWRGPFDPSSCERVRVGVCMPYHQLPGAIKPGIRSRGKQDVFFFFFFVYACVNTYAWVCPYTHSGVCDAIGRSSQSISGRNYRTLPPSNSLKWAWHYRRNIPFAN